MSIKQWHTGQPHQIKFNEPVNIRDMFRENINVPIFSSTHNNEKYNKELTIFRKRIYKLVGVMRRERYDPPGGYESLRKEFKEMYKREPPDTDGIEELYIKIVNYQDLE